MRRLCSYLFLSLLLTALFLPSGTTDVIRRKLAPGVEFLQEIRESADGPLLINVLRIDLKAPGVRVVSALGRDTVMAEDPTRGREEVGSLAARHGALAAINADFFPFTGDPLGIAIHNGELLSEGMPHRVAMGLTEDGRVLFDTLLPVGTLIAADRTMAALDGINRLPQKDEIVVLTPAYGTPLRIPPKTAVLPLANLNLPVQVGKEMRGVAGQVVSGDSVTALPDGSALLLGDGMGAEWLSTRITPGDTLTFRFDFVSNPLPPGPLRGDLLSRAGALRGRVARSAWTEVREAVGGGPWLVKEGAMAVDGVEQGFHARTFVQQRHPRTAVGITASGELLLVAVDGRQGHSRGFSLPELAAYVQKLGAVQAINLDGGGSTAMVIRGRYVNGPSDGRPRPVANALLVFANGESVAGDPIPLEPVVLQAGATIKLALPVDAGGPPLWGTLEGIGLVDQNGKLRSTRAGEGVVVAEAGGRQYRVPYTVLPGPPARLRASFGPVANNPPDRNALSIFVSDSYGNGIAGQEVQMRISGGMAERSVVTTDVNGRAVIEVVWDVEKGRRAVVTASNLPPVTLTAK